MLTGQRAFRGESPADTIALVLHRPPSELFFGADVAPGLAAAVRRCLAQEPGRRFQSAHDLALALESISHDGPRPFGITVTPPPGSVAVLPFSSLGAAGDDQYFSDGLAEDLVNALARLPDLRVASRTSSFRYRGRELDVRDVGRELGVGAVLEGSVRRSGTQLRLTVHLTSVDDGYHIWSGRYDRELADVFEVQDEVVKAIVAAIAPALGGGGEGHAVRRATTNPHAYDLYLKGRHLWNQRSPSVVGAAIACFEGAIALDDRFAAAYAGLADCYSILRVYGWMPAAQAQPKALDAATRALALDPQLPDAHRAKGTYTFHFEPHWRVAEEAFVAALALDPHDAICAATLRHVPRHRLSGRRGAGAPDAALERDPFSAPVHFLVASAACALCDAELAARHAARALELQPDALGPRWPQTVALLMTGRYAEAIAAGRTGGGADAGAGVRRRHGAGAGPGRTSRRRPPPGRGTVRTGRPRRVRLAGEPAGARPRARRRRARGTVPRRLRRRRRRPVSVAGTTRWLLDPMPRQRAGDRQVARRDPRRGQAGA